ncbi:MAG: heme lyase CcmF/NrfE family subunit [Candidatus Pelagibacter sp.]
MLSNLGFFSLFLGLISSFTVFLCSVFNIKKNSLNLENKIYKFLTFQFFFVVIGFFILLYSFFTSDFSNVTVYNNSHSTKPLFYKITGLWGNHEGSLLLWLLVLTSFILFFFFNSKNELKNFRLYTVIFHQIIIIGFFIFVLKTSNPFDTLFPIPPEGLGLNPILQDPALAIHPPILYVGYVGTSIIFASALAAMVTGYVNSIWAKNLKKWVLISWTFLTGGILLGSIWAYYELGWGGFWFWDPVENISLMPWLSLTALLHCISTLEKRDLLKSWSIILCIVTFMLSVTGTFLVRSGILNSVHTFANDPSRGIYILSFLFILIFMSFVIFFIFESKNLENKKQIFFLSKETSVLINNWFMIYFLSVVLIGTVYPIFLDVITSEKISVGPPFYNKLLIPFLVPFFLFMSVGPSMNWIKTNLKFKASYIYYFLLTSIATGITVYFLSQKNLLTIILIFSLFFLIIKTLPNFLKNNTNNSQNLSHLGFAMLMLSILFNSVTSTEIIKNIKVGDSFISKNEKITFKKVRTEEEKNYSSIIGIFEIKNNNNEIIKLNPEIRIYNQPVVATSEAAIKTTLFKDRFITINLIKDEQLFNVRYQNKPFMIWIWISTLIIIFGGTFAIFSKKKNYP